MSVCQSDWLSFLQPAQFVNIDLEEDEDSSDEEYCPDEEEEEEDTAEEVSHGLTFDLLVIMLMRLQGLMLKFFSNLLLLLFTYSKYEHMSVSSCKFE